MYRDEWPTTNGKYILEDWITIVRKVELRAKRSQDETHIYNAKCFGENWDRVVSHLTNPHCCRVYDSWAKEMKDAETIPHSIQVPACYIDFFNDTVARYQAAKDRKATKLATAS